MIEHFTPYSGTMKVSAEDAAQQLGLSDKLGNSFNAWAAVLSMDCFSDNPEEFQNIYHITLEEAAQLNIIMYGGI